MPWRLSSRNELEGSCARWPPRRCRPPSTRRSPRWAGCGRRWRRGRWSVVGGGRVDQTSIHFHCLAAVLDDAGSAVVRAADEAEAVGQQRQAAHPAVWCVKVRRTAPSLTLKSLTVLSAEPESACWLSGSATRARTELVCSSRRCSRGCRRGATRGRSAVATALRMRWPSGIAATARTPELVCPLQVLTRLLLATLHTLTSLSQRAADDVLAVGRHRHRVHLRCAPRRCGRASRRRGTAGPRLTK